MIIISYEDLLNLPKISGVTVIGNKKLSDFGLLPMSQEEILEIEYEVFGYNM